MTLICFSRFVDHKKQNLRFYSSNSACRQYWSSEKIFWEFKVWMSGFLNIRSFHLNVSCKKQVLKNFEKYLCCSFYFNIISARSAALSRRDSGIVFSLEFCKSFKNTYFVEHRRTASSEISSKNQNSSTG